MIWRRCFTKPNVYVNVMLLLVRESERERNHLVYNVKFEFTVISNPLKCIDWIDN